LTTGYTFEKTLKTKTAKEFMNVQSYLLVTSKQITRALYHTSVTPHQVIFISLIFGIAASYLIVQDNKILVITGAILLFYKNVLDKVDGSLARAKGLVSRRGRFYDSISDFIVSLSLFYAISRELDQYYQSALVNVICIAGLISSMLQCSFFIYYEVAYIHYSGKGTINRLRESITEEDKQNNDRFTLLLQQVFQLIYGWQDWIVMKIDKWQFNKLKQKFPEDKLQGLWYYHKVFLTTASTLCIGTHMVLIALFAVIGNFQIYLFINLVVMNLILAVLIPFHYFSVKSKLQKL